MIDTGLFGYRKSAVDSVRSARRFRSSVGYRQSRGAGGVNLPSFPPFVRGFTLRWLSTTNKSFIFPMLEIAQHSGSSHVDIFVFGKSG